MDFAKKQLEKYGWSEGKGLGKDEKGLSTALKPKLKFDNAGLGHDPGEQFTNNWWESLFNKASQNIHVQVHDDEVEVKVKVRNAIEISPKKTKKKLEYNTFIKTAKLTGSSVKNYEVEAVPCSDSHAYERLSDEKLFAVCGYRTGHKAAYHGMGLSGKLSRIEKQEKLLLKKLKNVSISDDKPKHGKKMKKLKKHKEEWTRCMLPSEHVSNKSLKKKNTKKKSVSFNETVTKIYTQELDTSFDSEEGSPRDDNSNDTGHNNSGSDEGIEPDLGNNNNEQEQDNHKAFEEARLHFSDLSKAERKKLKKRRKLEARLNSSTGLFLQSLDILPEDQLAMCDGEKRSEKRKWYQEGEDGDAKRNDKKKKGSKIKGNMNFIAKSLDNLCRISDFH
ncbi:G patch domain-containing protein 4 isoform X6 [Cylas formicarius]|uniref:G patch domain-containing protein 4 isoform X6 n=1 Tax=Cylas formicarius TaxID=197179 RepID=UPI002958C487|nr:G patch domain-containing protein 4 isoform X6 [Cylas formicarius]XP_060522186.1 G patch domain-containing protein 4 isoform X6 [Cylas formicarius]